MLRSHRSWRVAAIAAATFFMVSAPAVRANAQEAATKASTNGRKVLTLGDYGRWNRITSTALSPDGEWFAYALAPNDGDATLYVKQLDGNTSYSQKRGTGAAFSDDSKWAVYFVGAEQGGGRGGRSGGAAGGGGGAAGRMLYLLNLTNGAKDSIPGVSSFRFAEGSGFLAVKKPKPAGQNTHEGTDLILRDLRAGTSLNLGNVDEFAFNDPGTRLAYAVDAANRLGNGVFLMDLTKGSLTPLDTRPLEYNQLVWDEAGRSLAVLRGEKPKGSMHRVNTLMVVSNIGTPRQSVIELDPVKEKVLPAEMVISDLGSVGISKDGTRVYFGLKPQDIEPPKNDSARANVDVWHWKDEDVQSVQQVRAEQNRRFTYAATFHLPTRKFLRLADDEMRTVTYTNDGRWGIGRLDKPYRGEIAWGGSRADYYRIDLNTGERTPIVRALSRSMGASPDGKWYLYLKDQQVWAHQLATGTVRNLTELSGVDFVDKHDDHPYELPTYGVAGWSKDGKSVLLNHEFDIWSLPLEGGKAVNLTAGVGAAEQIRFRYARLDPEEEFIDTSKPLLLSAFGEWTKKSGYYELRPGAKPQPLIYADASIGQLDKADKADRIVYTRQTFVEFPDFWTSNTAFANPKRVTEANPQQSEYEWSPGRVLIDYVDARGNKLQATLALPANYEPGKRYPMLVYFYEIMSNQHHRYSMPTYDDRPHMSTYASDGYLVLQPDVVYTIGKPGTSAVDDVTSAVKKVIELGYADPKRIGLQGHSWGGYQSSYIITQTDMFAATVTGAPPTNLVSFYNELYKSTGTVQQGIMEVGQVRMGRDATPWTAHELYESQSPIHQAQNIKTPFLILHGTADGAVDWHQGLEYYNTARRLGKQVIFLSYPDEPHHLARRENQKDFQVRMKQFFDHYLKGTPAPKWMTDGVPFLQKGREK